MIELYTPVTKWSLNDKHNHIEDGWANEPLPKPKTQEQKKAWGKIGWVKEHMYLMRIESDYIKDKLFRDGHFYVFKKELVTPQLVKEIT